MKVTIPKLQWIIPTTSFPLYRAIAASSPFPCRSGYVSLAILTTVCFLSRVVTILMTVSFYLETDVIICTDCDIRRRYKYGLTKHKDYHPLVRFQYMEPTAEPEFTSLETKLLALETTINERLDRLEKRNADQDVTNGDRFDRSEMSMDRRIAELEVYVGGRFDTIETLLRALATKIGGQ
jgi:uncharacterized coiled-coil protein SlyX